MAPILILQGSDKVIISTLSEVKKIKSSNLNSSASNLNDKTKMLTVGTHAHTSTLQFKALALLTTYYSESMLKKLKGDATVGVVIDIWFIDNMIARFGLV